MAGPRTWIRKMAYWLPYHRDQYFLALQAAAHGVYKPRFEPKAEAEASDPATVRALANRELDAFSARADAAMRRFQQTKCVRQVR